MTRILAAILLCLSFPAAAVDAKVGGVAVTIPDPRGMVALKNLGSPMWLNYAKGQKDRGNRLLAVFAPAAAAARADAGEIVPFEAWAVAFATPKEDTPIDNGVFTRQIVPGMVDSVEGLPKPFGLYGKGPRHFSYGASMMSNFTAADGNKAPPMPVVSVINIVNVRDRVVGMVLYSRIQDGTETEIAAIKADGLAWTTATVGRNP
jgi:hypothetical protein